MEQNELVHYGVTGMKWGVRRAVALAKQNQRLGSKIQKKRSITEKSHAKATRILSRSLKRRMGGPLVRRALKLSQRWDRRARRLERMYPDSVKVGARIAKLQLKSAKKSIRANKRLRNNKAGFIAQQRANFKEWRNDRRTRTTARLNYKTALNTLAIKKINQKMDKGIKNLTNKIAKNKSKGKDSSELSKTLELMKEQKKQMYTINK